MHTRTHTHTHTTVLLTTCSLPFPTKALSRCSFSILPTTYLPCSPPSLGLSPPLSRPSPTPLLTHTTASLSFIHPTLTLPGATISMSPSSFRDTSTTLACFFYKEPNTHNASKPSHIGTELKLYYKMTEGQNMPARLQLQSKGPLSGQPK